MITKLNIQNFQSHAKTSLDFDPGVMSLSGQVIRARPQSSGLCGG